MYDTNKYIPPEIELYKQETRKIEIPCFKTLAEKANFKMHLELSKGKGIGQAFNYPVPLEPPYEYYEHTNLTEIDEHFFSYGNWYPCEYTEYDLAHIRVLLNDEIQPQHILSMLIALTGEQHISFEIVVKNEIKVYLTLPDFLKDTLLSQLYTFFPKSQFQIETQDPISETDDDGYPAHYVEYGLLMSNLLPLRILKEPEPLAYLIGLLEELKGFGFLQIMAVKCQGIWEQNLDLCLKDRYTFERIKFADFDVEKALNEKTKPPFYAVAFRIGFSNKEVCYRLHRFTTIFNTTLQQLVPLIPNNKLGNDVECRHSHHYGMLLSSEELVNLLFLPIKIEGSIRFKKVDFVEMPPPKNE